MKLKRIVATCATALIPMMAVAQTPNTPGGQASTGTPLDQNTAPMKHGNAKSMDHSTKYAPNADASTGTMSTDTGKPATKEGRKKVGKGEATAPGDVPTYPAPAKDGTPTK